jgi:hypothetical protein
MADSSAYTRRSLLAGAGLAGVATTLGVVGAQPAAAAPARTGGGGSQRALDSMLAPPGGLPTSIASAHTPGVTYYYRSQYDMRPIVYLEGYQVAGGVAYTNEIDGALVTTIQPPAGAILAEVEWYLKATSAQTIIVSVTVPGATAASTIFALPLGVPIPTELYAHKEIIDSGVNGPYPAGSTIIAGASSLADETAGVGGVRFGFKGGTQAPVLLPAPLRAYDSRSHDGPLSSGSTRVVSLAGQLPVGAVGAIVNLTVTHTVLTGFLKAYAAGAAAPSTSAINWYASGQTVANQATVGVSSARAIAITAGGHSADFIVDVVGYLV